MATFTLDAIRAAAEAKYGSTDIEYAPGKVCVLQNPLRLSKTNRDALLGIQKELEADDADQFEVLSKAIRLVAKTEAQGNGLLKAIGDDLAVLAQVFQDYSGGTQVGEASGSED